eukprot:CAMPEP_0114543756 /NCGR_PEP_ID=MMETSP0114-20121206/2524_1 /TAXON_ID=31324 /ORGANISM="Goniomonas sp, Strain m" /LENGTH=199 /DNA_ID=CAMNT_0001728113 /DNA_START=82 /DNA_END=678 /DNA_ORIENTATION=+
MEKTPEVAGGNREIRTVQTGASSDRVGRSREQQILVEYSDEEDGGGSEQEAMVTARSDAHSTYSGRGAEHSDSDYASARDETANTVTDATDFSDDERGGYDLALMPEEFLSIFSKARHNHYKEVALMFDQGAPIDGRDQFGNTVLHLACQNGHKRLAKACLRREADTNAPNYKGNTPLHFCFAFGYTELGEYLIAKAGA